MSQHHLTVISFDGSAIKLQAGFDPRLRQFDLSLRDVRLPGPDEAPTEETEAAPELLNYDSLGEPRGGLPSISDVEAVLEESGIPFGNDEDNPERLNPQLLPLLVVIMNEKEYGGDEVGRTIKFWNASPEPAAAD